MTTFRYLSLFFLQTVQKDIDERTYNFIIRKRHRWAGYRRRLVGDVHENRLYEQPCCYLGIGINEGPFLYPFPDICGY